MTYAPGGTSENLYDPSVPVVAVWDNPVPVFEMVIVAFGTVAPLGSVIVPVMIPCTVCATVPLARLKTITARSKHPNKRCAWHFVMEFPPPNRRMPQPHFAASSQMANVQPACLP